MALCLEMPYTRTDARGGHFAFGAADDAESLARSALGSGALARAETGIGGSVLAFIGSIPGAEATFEIGATTTLPELAAAAGFDAASAGFFAAAASSVFPQPDRAPTARASDATIREICLVFMLSKFKRVDGCATHNR